MLETPSRIWRRIEEVEDRDMPSLPSLPAFEDSVEEEMNSSSDRHDEEEVDDQLSDISTPIHSTPALSSHHTVGSTIRAPSSTSSTARFAHSIARSARSSQGLASSKGMSTRRSLSDSFDVSIIPSIPAMHYSDGEEEESKESVPNVYLPPEDEGDYGEQDVSLTEALQSVSRSGSPDFEEEGRDEQPTPKKNYDYSVSLRSEPKVCNPSLLNKSLS